MNTKPDITLCLNSIKKNTHLKELLFNKGNFQLKICIDFEIIAFLVEPVFVHFFHTYLRKTQENSEILVFFMKKRHKTYQKHSRFDLEIKRCWV